MQPSPYLVAFVAIAFGLAIADGNSAVTLSLFLALGILTGFFQWIAKVFIE